MDTPQERYMRDPVFNQLVSVIEAMLHRAEFTPSEVREAAMLACIRHENATVRQYRLVIPEEVEDAQAILDRWARGKEGGRIRDEKS